MKELRPWLRNYLPEAERTFDHLGTHEEVVHLKEIVSVYFCNRVAGPVANASGEARSPAD